MFLTELTQKIELFRPDMLIYSPRQGQSQIPNPETTSLESPSLKGFIQLTPHG